MDEARSEKGKEDTSRAEGSLFREEAAVIERPRPRYRMPCLAATFGFLVPGLGHLYAGKLRQGVMWYVAASLLPLLLALTGLQFSFRGFLLLLTFSLIVTAVVMVHGAIAARRQGSVMLFPWQRWWVYGHVIILAFALGTLMHVTVERKIMGVRVFKIPSGSMEPTLQIGDHIMVSIRAYQSSGPSKGDIVVFKHPKQPDTFFIKRVVAIGGDTVALRGDKLYVNGNPVGEPYIKDEVTDSQTEEKTFGPVTVEREKFFVLGDNRNNSFDSRQWGGLDTKDLVGKALFIYWSWDTQENGPRAERIGKVIAN